jgi:hypothetical protein
MGVAVWQLIPASCVLSHLTRVVCIHRDFTCLFFEENGTIPFYRRFLKKVFIRKFHELTRTWHLQSSFPSIGSSVTLGFSSVIAVVENNGVQCHAGFSSWI